MAIAPPVQLSERVHLLPGSVNVVLVVDGGRALVIDGGQGKDGGKRVRRALDTLGVAACAILTSHAHADHFGGHATRTGKWPSRSTTCYSLAIPDVDLPRWHLDHTTVQAHLQALRQAGVLRPRLVGHRLLWGPA